MPSTPSSRPLESDPRNEAHKTLPYDWRAVIEQAAESKLPNQTLGERMASVFIALKRVEYCFVYAEVTGEEFSYCGDVI